MGDKISAIEKLIRWITADSISMHSLHSTQCDHHHHFIRQV